MTPFFVSVTINVGHAEITYKDLDPVDPESGYGCMPRKVGGAFASCLAAARLSEFQTLAEAVQWADNHERHELYMQAAHTKMVHASHEYLDAAERSKRDRQKLMDAQVMAKARDRAEQQKLQTAAPAPCQTCAEAVA